MKLFFKVEFYSHHWLRIQWNHPFICCREKLQLQTNRKLPSRRLEVQSRRSRHLTIDLRVEHRTMIRQHFASWANTQDPMLDSRLCRCLEQRHQFYLPSVSILCFIISWTCTDLLERGNFATKSSILKTFQLLKVGAINVAQKAHCLCFFRLELEHFEREKRDREIRELREKELNERIKEEMLKSASTRLPNPMDSHWMDLRRFVFSRFFQLKSSYNIFKFIFGLCFF